MAVFNEPNQWEHPLGNNADTSTLPDDAAATAGTASLQKLFQLINATPLEAGGIAPDREDVNALFKYLGDQIFYTQNGGVPSYNAAYDYIPGRVVLYDNNLYKCIQANGVSSTVVAPGSDTAYWQRLDNYVRSVNGVNADTSGNADVISSGAGYVRFADGTQIVYQGYSQTAHPTSVQFVKPFTNIPLCCPVILHRGELAILSATLSSLSATGVSIYTYRNGNPIYNGLSMGFVAFGLWK